MLKSYFKIAIRNFLKNRVFSLINIIGLAQFASNQSKLLWKIL